VLALHNMHMLNVHELKAQDLHGLSPSSLAEIAEQMLQHIGQQSSRIDWQSKQLAERDRAIKFKDAKLERITFELARLKAWKFAAKTERMNAEQRQLFEETLAADEASLEAQLEALQAQAGTQLEAAPAEPRRRPKRQALPEHLVRVEHRHEPEDTTCPTPDCGQAMVRVGEDVSERLDIVPAQFFVHRHVRGKWACRCCELLVQEPVAPQIIDGGMPAAGLVAHTLVSRFVRTTARSRSTPARACTRRARRWRRGPGAVVLRCSRCSMRTRPSCSARRCCTPTRRR
jgi:transposase